MGPAECCVHMYAFRALRSVFGTLGLWDFGAVGLWDFCDFETFGSLYIIQILFDFWVNHEYQHAFWRMLSQFSRFGLYRGKTGLRRSEKPREPHSLEERDTRK
jgi:hypothetical protein